MEQLADPLLPTLPTPNADLVGTSGPGAEENAAAVTAHPTLTRSLPLQKTPHTTIHLSITVLATSTLVFLTSKTPADPPSSSALGSLVYALPNVSPPA